MKCEFGVCLVCEQEIASRCSECNSRKPNGQYTEVQLLWSNGSKMRTAVCLECAKERIWQADKMALTKAIWKAWDDRQERYDPNVVIV